LRDRIAGHLLDVDQGVDGLFYFSEVMIIFFVRSAWYGTLLAMFPYILFPSLNGRKFFLF